MDVDAPVSSIIVNMTVFPRDDDEHPHLKKQWDNNAAPPAALPLQ